MRVLEDGCVVVFGAGDEVKRADEMQESRWGGGLEWNGWNVPFTPPPHCRPATGDQGQPALRRREKR